MKEQENPPQLVNSKEVTRLRARKNLRQVLNLKKRQLIENEELYFKGNIDKGETLKTSPNKVVSYIDRIK
jgi:hypothetical protein